MPDSSLSLTRPPKYCRQVERGRADRAVVWINGKKIPLGRYGSPESRQKYAELIGSTDPAAAAPPTTPSTAAPLTVSQGLVRFLQYAAEYYRGTQDKEYQNYLYALKPVRRLAGNLPAAEFGPKLLKQARQELIDAGYSRKNVNKMTGRICRVFRWLAEEEIVPGHLWQSLKAVSGLREGRTTAKETNPVQPVADDVIEATLARLPEVVADMVRLQRLTAMRPGELCRLRPRDLDRSGPVWIYRPGSHKTKHLGRERVVPIGPQGQAILLRYLARDAAAPCFSPRDSEARRLAEREARRTTPANCGNRRTTNPKRKLAAAYTPTAYRRAVTRAAAAAKVEHWHPHRLRHSAATEIRREFGLEAAQVVLGHSSAAISQLYAERDLAKGLEVAQKIG